MSLSQLRTHKTYRARLIKEGLCPKCARKKKENGYYCKKCNKKQLIYQRRHHKKNKVRYKLNIAS